MEGAATVLGLLGGVTALIDWMRAQGGADKREQPNKWRYDDQGNEISSEEWAGQSVRVTTARHIHSGSAK